MKHYVDFSAISTVLASFFIHFLKSLDEGVCTILKFSLDEVGEKKKSKF